MLKCPLFALCMCILSFPLIAQRQEPANPETDPTKNPPVIRAPRPVDLPPMSRDAQVPDLGSLPPPNTQSPSVVKRAFYRLLPVCLDAMTHTCWTLAGDGPQPSPDDREFANDIEIGKTYSATKNYKGAELRFRHALEYRPDDPEANFRLAQSLDKQGKIEEARQAYQSYLELVPMPAQAEAARKALALLEKKASSAKRP